jgi:hypothetical protein
VALIKRRGLDRAAWDAFRAAVLGTQAAPRLAGRCRRCGAAVATAVELHRATAGVAVGNVHIACSCVELRARVELRRAPGGGDFGTIGAWCWRRCAPAAVEVRR